MSRELLIEKFNPSYTDVFGTSVWRNKKETIHRSGDNPAIITREGSMMWYKNGKCHRDNDKPAIIYASGEKEWHVNGKIIKETCYKNT